MKHKFLVVDDEPEIRRTILLQLEGTIYDVLEAGDGEAAITTLDNENILEIDVIICDVRMPKVNGVEAVAFFREHYPTITILVLTGYPDVDLAVGFMKSGVVDFLVKPVKKEKLLAAVHTAARQKTLFSRSGPMA